MFLWQVEGLVLVPGRTAQHPLAALRAGESVYLLDPREEKPWTIHSVYGHPVTCLDTSDCCVAFGVKRSGWAMHDGGNKVCSLFRCDEYLALETYFKCSRHVCNWRNYVGVLAYKGAIYFLNTEHIFTLDLVCTKL